MALILLLAAMVCGARVSAAHPPNTTLAFPESPPQFGYSLAPALPPLTFTQPVCLASPPGETNRLFVLEKQGTLVVITNLAAPTRTVFMRLTVMSDGESGLLGLAFHPGYATNRFFFVFSSRNLTTSQGRGRHQRLSRFETSPLNPHQGLAESELPLITQIDGADNHNGGDLHFGPDGYLYVSLGDEGPQRDGGNNSQTLTKNFFSAILRLDVDRRPENLLPVPHPANTTNYFVPADNPYVAATRFNGIAVDPARVRTEFYAVGFRNPWRMSFDRPTGRLLVGDVGQDAWEWVHLVNKGGNYGWVFREGLHPGFRSPPAGFSSIPPIHEYAHGSGTSRGNSITGGVVYRGDRLSQLHGAYVFADYVSGNVWTLRPDGTNVVPSQRITGGPGPVAFGLDPRNGDVLLALLDGRIMRLNYSPTAVGAPLPPTLADTGAFSDLLSLSPQPGILPYDLNVPFWSDGAVKRRWFSVPDPSLTVGFSRASNWALPRGAVWVKHFELEMTNGVPASRRRLETRFIVRGSSHVYGVTYRWNASQSNATLVPEEGVNEVLEVWDGATSRAQTWRYPSRAECLSCHTPAGGGALGFNTAQLNRDYDHGAGPENQIAALHRMGYLDAAPPQVHTLPSLAPATLVSESLESRVRSYLAANCAQCHQPGGSTPGLFDARAGTLSAETGLIGGALSNRDSGPDARVVVPGAPERSELLLRIARRGPRQMPPLASTVVDAAAVDLIREWILTDALRFQTFGGWQTARFPSPLPDSAAPDADPDHDGAPNYLEFLTGTNPLDSVDPWAIAARVVDGRVQIRFQRVAGRGFEVQWTADISDPGSWKALDQADNRPAFAAVGGEAYVEDAAMNDRARFYRVRVFER